MCCSVTSRSALTSLTPAPRGSLGRFHIATFGFLNSGMNFETGSLNTSLPSSINISTATAVSGFVIEAMRNNVSVRIALPDSISVVPCASKCTTLPLRATSVTAPAKSLASMWALDDGVDALQPLRRKPDFFRLGDRKRRRERLEREQHAERRSKDQFRSWGHSASLGN